MDSSETCLGKRKIIRLVITDCFVYHDVSMFVTVAEEDNLKNYVTSVERNKQALSRLGNLDYISFTTSRPE